MPTKYQIEILDFLVVLVNSYFGFTFKSKSIPNSKSLYIHIIHTQIQQFQPVNISILSWQDSTGTL